MLTKLLAGIVIVLITLLFLPTFHWMGTRFLEEESSYSHGFLVPLVSAYFVWQKRKRLKKIPPQSSKWGLIFVLGGVFLHLIVGSLWQIHFVSGFSLILIISGIILYTKGRLYLKELAFPIGFLVFAVPLPGVFLIRLSFHLKMFATKVSGFLAERMGVPLLVAGSEVILPNSTLEIGAPCSGLRSLISLIALAAIFTQFMPSGKIKKILLLSFAIPIALLANIFRITLLLMMSYFYGEEIALGFFHNFSGILLFAVATICLSGVTKVLSG